MNPDFITTPTGKRIASYTLAKPLTVQLQLTEVHAQ